MIQVQYIYISIVTKTLQKLQRVDMICQKQHVDMPTTIF